MTIEMLNLLSEISWSGWGLIIGGLVTLLVYLWDANIVHHRIAYTSYEGIPRNILLKRLNDEKWMWSRLPEVVSSGILEKMTDRHRSFQEAMFEFISTEVSYLKSLNILVEHFLETNDLDAVVNKDNLKVLIGNVKQVRECSKKFQKDLIEKWDKNLYVLDLGDVMSEYAEKDFRCYIEYCRNQPRQEKMITRLLGSNPVETVIRQKEASILNTQKLNLKAYLMTPMQRVTRYPLLMSAVVKLCSNEEEKSRCQASLEVLKSLVKECNEAARETQDCEDTEVLIQDIDFPSGFNSKSLTSFLLKSDFLFVPIDSNLNSSNQNSGSHLNWSIRKSKQKLHCLLLYGSHLVILNKRSSGKYEYNSMIPCQEKRITIKTMAALPQKEMSVPFKEYQYYFVLQSGSELHVYASKSADEIERWRLKVNQFYSPDILKNN